MKTAITKRQQQILDFISRQVQMRGYPPSVREIGAAVGLSSTASVHNQLNQLERKGFIRKDKSTTRGLVVLSSGEQFASNEAPTVDVPFLHEKASKKSVENLKKAKKLYTLPSHLVPAGENIFVLTLHDSSMTGAGVLNGDQLIVKKTNTAANGDMVAALIDDQEHVGIYTYYEEAGKMRFVPENPASKPIITAQAQIVGTVIGLYRSFL